MKIPKMPEVREGLEYIAIPTELYNSMKSIVERVRVVQCREYVSAEFLRSASVEYPVRKVTERVLVDAGKHVTVSQEDRVDNYGSLITGSLLIVLPEEESTNQKESQ